MKILLLILYSLFSWLVMRIITFCCYHGILWVLLRYPDSFSWLFSCDTLAKMKEFDEKWYKNL